MSYVESAIEVAWHRLESSLKFRGGGRLAWHVCQCCSQANQHLRVTIDSWQCTQAVIQVPDRSKVYPLHPSTRETSRLSLSQLPMAIIKDQKLDDPSVTLNDPPPSYRRVASSSIRGSQRSTPTLTLPSSPSSSTPSPNLPAPKLGSKKSKLKFIDLFSGKGQSFKDVKKMAYGSVLNVAKNPRAQGSAAVIETCAEVCQANGVNFSSILQDPCIEKHRALYWVIISRPPPEEYGVLSAILKHSGPLSSEAIDEVRLACVQVGDQRLFSHFWRHPSYSTLSGTDELLLGSTPPDYVEVQEATDNEIATFTTRLQIAQFHKRMNVSGKIVFEFIARGSYLC